MYLKFGSAPTRGDYDYLFDTVSSADQRISVPLAYAGTWFVLVYSNTTRTPSAYTLRASSFELGIDSITPDHYAQNADAQIEFRKFDFDRQARAHEFREAQFEPDQLARRASRCG